MSLSSSEVGSRKCLVTYFYMRELRHRNCMVLATVVQWVSPWAACETWEHRLLLCLCWCRMNCKSHRYIGSNTDWGLFLSKQRSLGVALYKSDGVSLPPFLIPTKRERSSMQLEKKTKTNGKMCVLWSKAKSFLCSLQFKKSVGMDACQHH